MPEPMPAHLPENSIAFTGSIPALYDQHLGPLIFEPYARDLARRVAEARPRRVLEIACGTGRVTRQLDALLPPDVTIVATDLSESMLSYARESVAPSTRLSWQQADGAALTFADGAFDAVVCQFGLMFFPDRLAGLREMHRVTAPGGRLFLSTWDSRDVNRFAHIVSERVAAFFVESPPVFMDVPFSLYDRVAMRVMALGAGYEDAEIEALPAEADGESAASAACGFVRGNPLAMQLQERGANMEAIERSVADGLQALGGARPIRFAMQALLMQARRRA